MKTLVLKLGYCESNNEKQDKLKQQRDKLINTAGYYMSLGLKEKWQKHLNEAGEITHKLVKMQRMLNLEI